MADRLIDTLFQTMPWSELDAVVFDIGGVLVGIDGRKALADMFPDDDPGNVEAAMALGWQGFCMNEPGRLAAFIGCGEGQAAR